MVVNVLTNNGKNIMLNRTYKTTPDYTIPSQLQFGINNGTPLETDTGLDYPIPIDDGVVNDDGSNTLTGSSGGDNSTNNTSVYKPGAGTTDATAQNLIANNTNATKIWTISNLATAGNNIDGTKYIGLWLYIKNGTTLVKFFNGTCIELKFGSDSSNYYSKTWDRSELSVGWNWLHSSTTAVEDLTETGTVSGNIDTFIIEITTINATDEFVAGDVVYDLLRTWDDADTLINFESGFPSFTEASQKVEVQGLLNSVKANGFDINACAVFNTDSPKKCFQIITFTAESKSDTDELAVLISNSL